MMMMMMMKIKQNKKNTTLYVLSIRAGHTDDYRTMLEHLENKYPSTYIVAVGFSLGGNIVTKYMGEREGKLPRNVIGGISICQGYNAVEYVLAILSRFNSTLRSQLLVKLITIKL